MIKNEPQKRWLWHKFEYQKPVEQCSTVLDIFIALSWLKVFNYSYVWVVREKRERDCTLICCILAGVRGFARVNKKIIPLLYPFSPFLFPPPLFHLPLQSPFSTFHLSWWSFYWACMYHIRWVMNAVPHCSMCADFFWEAAVYEGTNFDEQYGYTFFVIKLSTTRASWGQG